jgi:hypothetical protein
MLRFADTPDHVADVVGDQERALFMDAALKCIVDAEADSGARLVPVWSDADAAAKACSALP